MNVMNLNKDKNTMNKIVNYIKSKLKTMDKAAAQKELNSIDERVKELRRIIEAPVKITDRVKTFEDACSVLGINTNSIYDCGDTKDEIAYKKLKLIAKALNEGWKPNWENGNEYKYYPWFKMQSGFGFSNTSCASTYSYAGVGSRLCFKTDALAKYAGQQFESIYKDLLTLEN